MRVFATHKMVVGSDAERLDAALDEELGQARLDLGLTALEVVATNVGLVLLGELDAAGDKGVLGGAVDVRHAFEDGRHGEQGRGRHFGVAVPDGLFQVGGRVVDAGDELRVALGVGGPEDDDRVEPVLGLEGPDVVAELVKVSLLVFAGDDVVGALLLVGVDAVAFSPVSAHPSRGCKKRGQRVQVGVVDAGKRDHLLHDGGELTLEVPLEDLGPTHGLVEREAGDVPAADDEVRGVDHREHVRDGNVDVLARLGVGSEPDCAKHESYTSASQPTS